MVNKLLSASKVPHLHVQAYAVFCDCRENNVWSFETFAKSLSSPYSFIAINSDETVIGCMIVNKIIDELEIEDICVAPQYRNYGVASALLEHLILYAKLNNVSRVLLEVSQLNTAALSLYKKLNFKPNGVRKNYYKIDSTYSVDAILMELVLQ